MQEFTDIDHIPILSRNSQKWYAFFALTLLEALLFCFFDYFLECSELFKVHRTLLD